MKNKINFSYAITQMGAMLLAVNVFFCESAHAQLDVVNDLTIEEYVNDVLLGEGVTAFNVTYTGGMSQLGKMVNGSDSDYAFDEGLVLSTANARGIGCSSASCSDCLGNAVTDSSLLEVANLVPELIGQSFAVNALADVCILEFDFVVTGDSIGFDYIFGSDEYEAWVNTQYNDVFGFFLSGPGISGPYESPENFPDGAINIAGVPGTNPNLPITVSSVNSSLNSEFFIFNLPYDGICINGYTTVFHAGHPVECGSTYHIKLAIADGTDAALESVVILEQGSFVSNVPVVISDAVDVGSEGGETLFEGCGSLEWTFTRPEEVSTDTIYQVLLSFESGEAVNGIDFGQLLEDGSLGPFPDTITFDEGVTEIEYTLIAIDDEEDEGGEDLIATISSIESCLEGFVYLTYEILDGPDPIEIVPVNTISCSNSSIIIAPVVTGGYGNYEYDWSCSNSSAASITVNPDENWTCVFTVSDTCGVESVSAINSISLLDSIPLSADLIPDTLLIIPGDSASLVVEVSGGWSSNGDFDINWYINDSLMQSGTDLQYAYQPELDDFILVEVEDDCGNTASDTLTIGVLSEVEAIITLIGGTIQGPDSIGNYACKGSEVHWSSSNSTNTLDSVLYYLWNWGDGTQEYTLSDTVTHEWSAPGIYQVTLEIAGLYDAYDVSEPFEVVVTPTPNFLFTRDSPVCIEGTGEAEALPYASNFTQTVYYAGPEIYLADSVAFEFEFPIEVSGFSADAVIANCNDLKRVRAKLEHDYVGALDVWVTCPNDAELWLLKNNEGTDDCNGDNDVDDAVLGMPVAGFEGDSAGAGATYSWKPTGMNFLDDFANPMFDGVSISPGSYTSCNDWCEMEGCPINGTWTLHIATVSGLGAGHLFDWNLELDHEELDDYGLDGLPIDSAASGFNWGSLGDAAIITESSDGFAGSYEVFAQGQHSIDFTLTDGLGCTTTKTTMIQLNDGLGFEVIGGNNPNACASSVFLTAELGYTSFVECPGMPFSNSWCVGNNVDTVFTVCPMIQGDGSLMHLMFENAVLDTLGDALIVYDGSDTNAPTLGTFDGDLSNMEWAATNPGGCLTFRFVMNDSLSCEDGAFEEMNFTIDCNPFFLDVLWHWSPAEFVLDSTSQNTVATSNSVADQYVVTAYYENQPTCVSRDTLHVVTTLNAETLTFQPDCDISNGTLVIDVDAPGVQNSFWTILLTDSLDNTISDYTYGDPLAFTYLSNGVYDVNVSNENCFFNTEIVMDSDQNQSATPCGCTYSIFPNYDPEAILDDGSCTFDTPPGPCDEFQISVLDISDSTVTISVSGGEAPFIWALNGTETEPVQNEDGDYVFESLTECTYYTVNIMESGSNVCQRSTQTLTTGCTVEPPYPCDFETWCEENYECIDPCPADIDENGVVSIGDLLDLMAAYGSTCE